VNEKNHGPISLAVRCISLLLLVWVAGGAGCPRRSRPSDFVPPPQIFAAPPDLDQVVAAVNRTDVVEKMQSSSASIELLDSSLPVSRLSATLAVQRPRGLRVRASLPIMLGAGLDLGSNDEVFWMQYPEGFGQTLMFARHDQYQQRMLTAPLPVPPNWIIEALGLVHIDPQLVSEGPLPRGDGQLEIRTRIPTASGTYQRVLLVDDKGGFVREQHVYGPDGRLVARATGSDHRFYDQFNVVMPHSVKIQLEPVGAPPIGLAIEVGDYVLNQLLGSDPNMFTMPSEGNLQVIDLGKIGPTLPPATLQPQAQPAPAAEPVRNYVPTASYVPAYRGITHR
jgi:hypothetical protein